MEACLWLGVGFSSLAPICSYFHQLALWLVFCNGKLVNVSWLQEWQWFVKPASFVTIWSLNGLVDGIRMVDENLFLTANYDWIILKNLRSFLFAAIFGCVLWLADGQNQQINRLIYLFTEPEWDQVDVLDIVVLQLLVVLNASPLGGHGGGQGLDQGEHQVHDLVQVRWLKGHCIAKI